MQGWIQNAKNIFYFAGSLSGLVALLRPIFESKHQRDMDRASTIISRIDEVRIIDLPNYIYLSRHVADSAFSPFRDMSKKLDDGLQDVRFTGPLQKYLTSELKEMVSTYHQLRNYIQVPAWESRFIEGTTDSEWLFNKQAFFRDEEPRGDYAKHLEETAEVADRLKKRFLRFQALTELHYFEASVPWFSVPRKFKATGLDAF